MIGIIDYGMGNLRSVQKAFEFVGEVAEIFSDSSKISNYSHLVLPGVGAFRDGISAINQLGFDNAIKTAVSLGIPLLGICLGYQLLFTKSYENGEFEGLGIIDGEVVKFSETLKVPHMGWNDVCFKTSEITKGLSASEMMYFVHSYHAVTDEANYLGVCNYGHNFVAAIKKGNVYGFQFHPEKSEKAGLTLLKNFANL